MNAGVVIIGADIGTGRPQQIRIDDGSIIDIRDCLGPTDVPTGARVLDAAGRGVLPAFTDHHLHLHALAVAEHSVSCGPPDIIDAVGLSKALRAAPSDPSGWVRGVGYHESVAGELSAAVLDAMEPSRPLRISHRSGAMWMLNSVALRILECDDADHPGVERDGWGHPTGRLWRADDWLRSRLHTAGVVVGLPSLAQIGRRIRDLGIAEMTDATPDLDDAALANLVDAVDRDDLHGRLHMLGVPLGRRLEHPRITVGPYKIVIADSALPTLDQLVERIVAAHDDRRAVAVHCVSRVAYALLIAAFDIAGVQRGDRVEHGGVLDAAAGEAFVSRGLSLITQPGFLADRGDDFLDDSEPADRGDLYRCGSLLRAGAPVALSSDAPYGPLDPWTTISAAVERRTRRGRVVGPAEERLEVAQALRAHQSPAADPSAPPRRIEVGASGALIVIDRPYAEMLEDPGRTRTVETVF